MWGGEDAMEKLRELKREEYEGENPIPQLTLSSTEEVKRMVQGENDDSYTQKTNL